MLEADNLELLLAGIPVCGSVAAVLGTLSKRLDCPSQTTRTAFQESGDSLAAPLVHSPMLLWCPHMHATSPVSQYMKAAFSVQADILLHSLSACSSTSTRQHLAVMNANKCHLAVALLLQMDSQDPMTVQLLLLSASPVSRHIKAALLVQADVVLLLRWSACCRTLASQHLAAMEVNKCHLAMVLMLLMDSQGSAAVLILSIDSPPPTAVLVL